MSSKIKSLSMRDITPFAYGFRPFFLLAGWFALIAIGAWLWINLGSRTSFLHWPASFGPLHLWHGHEMLFGFVTAAIAGFLLTAVPSWTGSKGFAGWPLVLLTVCWFLGRAGFFAAGALPFYLLAGAELVFLPGLLVLIAPALLRARNRNTPLLLVILVLWCCDAVFLRALYLGDTALARAVLMTVVNVIVLLITVIGGRIVPAFTGNALRKRGVSVQIRSSRLLDGCVISMMLAVVLLDVVMPGGFWSGGLAALAGLAQLWRLAGWKGVHTLRDPIVWVLHMGYAWIAVGLLLKACFILGGYSWAAFWQHALMAGAAATMILAVMSRASLGHTGRPLSVAPSMVAAYVLLSLAVLVRVFGPALLPIDYSWTISISGLLWMLSFGIYAAVYTPILLLPRADGKQG